MMKVTPPNQRSYDEAKEIARQMWNAHHDIAAVAVQKVGASDTGWRVSDCKGSICGYIDIETGEFS